MSARLRLSLLGANECMVSVEGGEGVCGGQIQANVNSAVRLSALNEPLLCAQHMLGTKPQSWTRLLPFPTH